MSYRYGREGIPRISQQYDYLPKMWAMTHQLICQASIILLESVSGTIEYKLGNRNVSISTAYTQN